jgi:hypothetical protein
MKPGDRQKNHKKNQKTDIATVKPGMLIETHTRDCAQEKDAESPSTKALTGRVSLCSEAFSTTHKAGQRGVALVSTRRFHTV